MSKKEKTLILETAKNGNLSKPTDIISAVAGAKRSLKDNGVSPSKIPKSPDQSLEQKSRSIRNLLYRENVRQNGYAPSGTMDVEAIDKLR